MKRIISGFLVLLLLFNMTGCAAIKKKFTRKKKNTVHMPRIYQVQKYKRKPSSELYKKHYVYWSSWQAEIEKSLGQSRKKDLVCIEQILGNLKDMEFNLAPEKAAELRTHIDRIASVKNIILKDDMSTFNKSSIMMTLEKEGRFIPREFSYKKVQKSFRKDLDEEQPATK